MRGAWAKEKGLKEVAAGRDGAALVTGAARRIGHAIAERLAREGRAVVLHASARSAEDAERAAQAIRHRGGRAAVAIADLADASETQGLIETATRAFGPLSVLVNNASIFEVDAADDFSVALYERQMAINLRAPLLLARDFAARLPEPAEGVVINVIDQRVWRLTPLYFSYTLAKSALWSATRTMAQAYAPRIRVNAVGPGPVFPNAALGDREFDIEAHGVPLGHAVELSGVVDAVIYLIGARSVTGQMIAVDSGQHLAWRTPDVATDEETSSVNNSQTKTL